MREPSRAGGVSRISLRSSGLRRLRGRPFARNWNCARTSNIVAANAVAAPRATRPLRKQSASREETMKAYLVPLLLLPLAGPAMAQQSAPEIPFNSVPDFPKLPPGMNFGEVPGVAVNSKGHVFVFTRSNSANGPAYAPAAAQLLEFDRQRRVRRRNRQGPLRLVVRPQRAHRQGRQHLGDRQGLGHDRQVQPGRPRRLGVRPPQGIGGRRDRSRGSTSSRRCPPSTACSASRPTSPGIPQGNIYITDGYINSRVAKYDKNGDWVKSWGEKGTGPGQFRTAARDRDRQATTTSMSATAPTAASRCSTPTASFCACSRSTCRRSPAPTRSTATRRPASGSPQVIGAPNSLCITPGPNQVMFVGESTFPGRIFKVSLDGKVLGVIGKSGRNLKQFSGAHALACPSENEIYAAETANWRVQKLRLHPRMRGGRNDAARSRPEPCTMRPEARSVSWIRIAAGRVAPMSSCMSQIAATSPGRAMGALRRVCALLVVLTCARSSGVRADAAVISGCAAARPSYPCRSPLLRRRGERWRPAPASSAPTSASRACPKPSRWT